MKKIINRPIASLTIMAVIVCLILGLTSGLVAAATATKEINLSGFNSVSIGGSWDVSIVRGASYKIVVTAPEEYIDTVCTLDNTKLTVQKPNISWSWLRFWDVSVDGRNKIQITAPDLGEISFSGSTNGVVSGFKHAKLELRSGGSSDLTVTNCQAAKLSISCSGSSDIAIGQSIVTDLVVNCSGSSKIKAESCSITNLALELAGSSRFAFINGTVTNLRVDLAGSADVAINKMSGGKMTGSMSGSCNLTYSGVISGYGIQTSGSSKVRME